MTELHAIISVDVQGVGFRYAAVEVAQGLELGGWVKNEADGTVKCLAAGSKEKLERFLAWLHRGPSGAYVTGVEYEYKEGESELPRFTIC